MPSSCCLNLDFQCHFLYSCCAAFYWGFRKTSGFVFAVNTKWIDGSPDHPSWVRVTEQRRCHHRGTCTRLCLDVWLQHESGWEQRGCLSLPAPPHCLSHQKCWGVWWWHVPAKSSSHGQSPPACQTCGKCCAHTCTGLQRAAAPAETVFERKGKNCRLWEGWQRGLRNRGKRQSRKAAGCLFILLFQMEDVCSVLPPAT